MPWFGAINIRSTTIIIEHIIANNIPRYNRPFSIKQSVDKYSGYLNELSMMAWILMHIYPNYKKHDDGRTAK